MSEEPLFDPSLKKRKKKAVAFSEEPLGAEADPTTPAPATIDDTTTNGERADMAPKTAHEQMKENEGAEEDLNAMFGDLKKKKKKKSIPMDLVCLLISPRNMRSILMTSPFLSLSLIARRRFRYLDTHSSPSRRR